MRINRKRLQAMVSGVTFVVLLVFLVIEGGGYLASEYRKDVYRLSEIQKIESKTGKTVGQLGEELRAYCKDMASTKADERVAAMVAQAEKLQKALSFKISAPRSYDREHEEIERSTFNRCLDMSDANGVGYYYYEISGDVLKDKLIAKFIKLLISSVLSLVMVVCVAWVAGNFVVRTIPFVFALILNSGKKFINWITAPEK